MPTSHFEFQIRPADPRSRIDRLVVELLGRAGRPTTRAEVQRWIDQGLVRLNGQPTRRSASVPAGAIVEVRAGEPPSSEARPDPSVAVDVVYEDEHLMVVEKPAGLVVHPARGHRDRTLVHGLLAHGGFERDAADGRDPQGHLRPGIVHRLDKDTSGLLVVARTARAREGLKEQFAAHSIERCYGAIAVGRTVSARYDTPYGRHPRSRIRFTSRLSPDRPGTKRAVTLVEPVELLPAATVVHCRLQTGRTHQIRVHLAEQARTAVLGDPLYGSRQHPLEAVAAALGRQALHAQLLGFVHPLSGQRMRFESAWPEDMQQALGALRQEG